MNEEEQSVSVIGGWSLYAKNGKLKYCYNWGGFKNFFVESANPLRAGQHQVRMEFAYAGGGLGTGGKATLFVDGSKPAFVCKPRGPLRKKRPVHCQQREWR